MPPEFLFSHFSSFTSMLCSFLKYRMIFGCVSWLKAELEAVVSTDGILVECVGKLRLCRGLRGVPGPLEP